MRKISSFDDVEELEIDDDENDSDEDVNADELCFERACCSWYQDSLMAGDLLGSRPLR
jgi:hypothetical protein